MPGPPKSTLVTSLAGTNTNQITRRHLEIFQIRDRLLRKYIGTAMSDLYHAQNTLWREPNPASCFRTPMETTSSFHGIAPQDQHPAAINRHVRPLAADDCFDTEGMRVLPGQSFEEILSGLGTDMSMAGCGGQDQTTGPIDRAPFGSILHALAWANGCTGMGQHTTRYIGTADVQRDDTSWSLVRTDHTRSRGHDLDPLLF